MQEKELSQSILEKIKSKHILPKPRWTFLLEDYVIWIFALASLLFGSLAVAVIIFMLRHNDWGIYEQLSDSFFGFILVTLPYFWIIFLIIFVAVSYYNFRHTKKGYRHRFSVIMAGSIILSIMAGEVLYQAGIGQAIDEILGANLPLYRQVFNPGINIWSQPEQGHLAGIIINIDDLQDFMLLDPEEEVWSIGAEDATIAPQVILRIGERVKMIGQISDGDSFNATLILPFGPPGKGFFEERFRRHQDNPEQMMPMLPLGPNFRTNIYFESVNSGRLP